MYSVVVILLDSWFAVVFFFSIKKIGGELSGGQGSEPPASAAKLQNTVFMFSRCSVG